ncbi:MAG: hypothetical protein ACFE8M_04420 [Candidatus Hermodarchaeota archaeon]
MEGKDKDNEDEYKERIKKLIDRIEKGKDNNTNTVTPEMYQLFLEKLEELKLKVISKMNHEYRDERLIVILVYVIREYYWLRADPKYPNEKDQFLDKIDELYKLIYEELKKPSPFVSHYTPEERKNVERFQRRRIVYRMTQVLGLTNVSNDFNKKYNVHELMPKERMKV